MIPLPLTPLNELSCTVRALPLDGMLYEQITEMIAAAVEQWAADHQWPTQREVFIEGFRRAFGRADRGRADLVIATPDSSIVVEIDRWDKPLSLAKLEHVAEHGAVPVWIRWDRPVRVAVPAPIFLIHVPVGEATLLGPGNLPRWFVRQFNCPLCGSGPGVSCVESVRKRPSNHRERLRVAQNDPSSGDFAEALAPDIADVAATACPECEAPASQPCVRENGLPRVTFHSARAYAAVGLLPPDSATGSP